MFPAILKIFTKASGILVLCTPNSHTLKHLKPYCMPNLKPACMFSLLPDTVVGLLSRVKLKTLL